MRREIVEPAHGNRFASVDSGSHSPAMTDVSSSRFAVGASSIVLTSLSLLAQAADPSVARAADPAVMAAFEERYGRAAAVRLQAWVSLMREKVDAPEADKRELANRYFNAVPWVSDMDHWGQRDYWATPMEMIGTNGGDCEDYSIGKYFTLTEMRIERSKLLITYVRAPRLKQSHMVLAYYPRPGADPLILDNLTDEILPGSSRRDLIPIYSFNAVGLWKAVQRGRGKRAGSPKRLNMWQDMLRRMRAQFASDAG